jgi:hypothetical protein
MKQVIDEFQSEAEKQAEAHFTLLQP